MAEADHSIHQFDHHPKRETTVCRMGQGETTQAQRAMMTRAISTLALQGARAAVKDNLKKQKIRLADVDARDIMRLAKDYLEQHPQELIARAQEIVSLWFRQGRFGPRGGFRSR